MMDVFAHDSRLEMQNTRLEEIGSAAAGIAHDINNQLILILNHLATPDLEGARVAASRCTALTKSLLSYCRGESLALRSIDLGEFIHDFVDSLSLPNAVQLTVDLPTKPLPVKADPAALARVLTNLVSNGVDAMRGVGSLRIAVSDGRMEIRDSGPGITREHAKRIFEPFFSTKGKQGTGLGLAIVREIMRQHGGSVSVESEPGRGAAFILRFRSA